MKNFYLLIALALCMTFVTGAETFSSVTTNSPVPIDSELVIRGTYNNTDSNKSVYCKFEIRELDTNTIMTRFSDELTFSNGTFYSEKLLREPPFLRETDYNALITCGTINTEKTFSVVQRKSFGNSVMGELLFIRDDAGNLLFFALGAILLVGIGAVTIGYATKQIF